MKLTVIGAADGGVRARRAFRLMRPRTPNQLHAYIRTVLGFRMPRTAMTPGHDAPFAYVEHAFFEDRGNGWRDCIVWANRGGGKTQIGAIATLLDLVFKPGIQVRILGGSFDQSSRMHRYLKRMLETEVFEDLIEGNLTGRFVELTNGSRVEVLSQSECAVRGQRVHKLRCDEVELFDPDIWDAAQMVTRSGRCGGITVQAAIETLSTMHRPFGMMQRLVRTAAAQRRRVFRWNVLDTLTRCEPARACEDCPLWDECRGRAKRPATQGFFNIDDAIQQKRRIGAHTWAAEMLCEEPSRADSVYPEFDPNLQVINDDPAASMMTSSTMIAGIDFGYRAPTAMLWAHVDDEGVITVLDELVREGLTTEKFIAAAGEQARAGGLARPAWIGADPAGHQRSEQTGVSAITVWKRAGWNMRTRSLRVEAGIDAVRRRWRRADGSIGLRIHRRCAALIEALIKYHYPPERPESLAPVKDGNDHVADALRYMIVNLDGPNGAAEVRQY